MQTIRMLVRAFSLGAGALSAAVLGLALSTAVIAAAAGLTFDVRLLGLETLAVSSGVDTSSAFGPGLVVVGLAGGVVNAAAALVLVALRRRGRRPGVPV